METFIHIDASRYSFDLTEEQKFFADLNLLQKYDAVLDVLFKESGKSPTFDDINKVLLEEKKKVHWGEVMDILYTMIGDSYLYGHFTNQKKEQIFLISFNGKNLKETGGLEKKIEREKIKEQLSSDLNDSNLKTGRWTRNNIILTAITGGITLIALLTNLGITINRESKESQRHLKDSLQQVKSQENASELNKELRQIHQYLQDTAKVRLKIEK
jgi:hypothetical protein